jgi:o-succinylbenzoate synthase
MLKAKYHKHILRFNFPAGTSRGVLNEKVSWFVDLFNESNPEITGRGECSLIKGLSPDPEAGYQEMLARVCAGPERFLSFTDPELDKYPSIRFGLEMAFRDLQEGGKGELFKSAFTEGQAGISINGLIWMGSKNEMLQQIKQRIDEGFTCIKMKIGALDFEDEIDLLRTIRKEFHQSVVQLRVDANGAFLPDEALAKLERFSVFQLHSIEQPIKPGDIEAMARLCEKTPLPVALDEELFAPGAGSNKSDLLKTIKPQYLVLKPSMLGGFAKTQEWIDAANSMNIGWWVTSALESNIGLNALAQWTYTLNNPMHHGLGTGKLFVNNLPGKLFIENGYLKLFNRYD